MASAAAHSGEAAPAAGRGDSASGACLRVAAAALAMALSGLKRRQRSEDMEAQAEVARLQQQTIALSDEIRHLSHELHPGVLQHAGLVAALQGHCDEFGRQHETAVTFRSDGDLEGVPAEVALCLYRVTQEALHNVVKHAEATAVTVRIVVQGGGNGLLVVDIEDDGIGFRRPLQSAGSLGMLSMRERAQRWGGSVVLRSRSGRGGHLRATIPLPAMPTHHTHGPGAGHG